MIPPFKPYMPRGDGETFRFAEDITRLLNRPYRNEFCAPVPCDDALLVGRSMFGLSPATTIGAQTPIRVAGAQDATALVGASVGTNSIKAVPFVWGNGFPVATIGCNVTTGVGTSKARVGIYECNNDVGGVFEPTNLIVGSGELDCSGIAMVTTTGLSASLEPGHVYYAAFLSYTAAATVSTIPVAGMNTILESVAGAFTTHLSVAYTSASSSVGLPAVFPSGSIVQTGAPPAVFLTATTSSNHVATLVRSGHSPYLGGLILRRVRLTRNSALARVTGTNPSVKIRALIANAMGSVEVGTFDSLLGGLDANSPRLISANADLNRDVAAGSVFQAEITQRGWPKVSMRDATVLFDLAVG
jgi:hypothetical protein